MKRFLMLFAMMLVAATLLAQNGTINFAWDPYADASLITGFRLYQSKVSGTYSAAPVATFTSPTAVTGSIPRPGLGKYFYVLRAFADLPEGQLESDNSNEVTVTIKPKPPKLNSAVHTALSAPVKGAEHLARALVGKPKTGLRVVE